MLYLFLQADGDMPVQLRNILLNAEESLYPSIDAIVLMVSFVHISFCFAIDNLMFCI